MLSLGNPGRSLWRITQVIRPSGWDPFSAFIPLTPSAAQKQASLVRLSRSDLKIISTVTENYLCMCMKDLVGPVMEDPVRSNSGYSEVCHYSGLSPYCGEDKHTKRLNNQRTLISKINIVSKSKLYNRQTARGKCCSVHENSCLI